MWCKMGWITYSLKILKSSFVQLRNFTQHSLKFLLPEDWLPLIWLFISGQCFASNALILIFILMLCTTLRNFWQLESMEVREKIVWKKNTPLNTALKFLYHVSLLQQIIIPEKKKRQLPLQYAAHESERFIDSTCHIFCFLIYHRQHIF